MPSCCILQCGAKKDKNAPLITLHRFPRNEDLHRKWLDAIGIENINPRHKNWLVCSLYFKESNFNKTLDVVRLRDNVISSISLILRLQHALVYGLWYTYSRKFFIGQSYARHIQQRLNNITNASDCNIEIMKIAVQTLITDSDTDINILALYLDETDMRHMNTLENMAEVVSFFDELFDIANGASSNLQLRMPGK